MKQLIFGFGILISVMFLSSSKVAALPLLENQPNNKTDILEAFLPKEPPKQKPEQIKPKKYTVVKGDTLDKIAKKEKTTVQRLYDKNLHIKHPDRIAVGQKLTIPNRTEKLRKRPVPRSASSTAVMSSPIVNAQPRGSTDGNGYTYGYCTYYVKNRRPDIPNSWGNADTWDDYAPGSGYKVGDKPKAGAIGVTRAYMHVVYVEKVNKDGTILVSEMNYEGFNVISSRVANASEFRYIY